MIKGFSNNDLVKKRMPTITDVAKAAGVSIATASVVVNNKSSNIRISENTKQKVQEAVKKLDYHPSPVARGLRLQKTGLLGVIVGDIKSSIMPEILQGIEDVAKSSDYSLILGTTDLKGPDEKYYLELLNDKKVDGIITMPSVGENLAIYREILEKRFPCVFVARRLVDIDIPYIMVDGEALGYLGAEHLIRLGHRNIAFVGTTEGHDGVRFFGYRRALQEHGISIQSNLIEEGFFEWEFGYKAANKLLDHRESFSAVFCQDDVTALGVIACFKDNGLNVPEDVSIVGCDDIPMAHMASPALTTVAQPKSIQGELAARMLIDMINGKNVSGQVLKPQLIIRQTTKEV